MAVSERELVANQHGEGTSELAQCIDVHISFKLAALSIFAYLHSSRVQDKKQIRFRPSFSASRSAPATEQRLHTQLPEP